MDEEEIIRRLKKMSKHAIYTVGEPPLMLSLDDGVALNDAVQLLKEQEEIKEQFIEAFNTIRDAYNTPANREKILLSYLLRKACCCADCERKESR